MHNEANRERRMSDIKLFQIKNSKVSELESSSVELEKSLQVLIEKHLDTFLGIRFLKTEHDTGREHGGRIDTLGIDENNCPVIIEYKRSINENVMAQGLFYLDWLMDHKAEFELLVRKKLGDKHAENIEWSNPRLICIAGDYTKYDEHAVKQINRNIELIRYRNYGTEFLLFELVNAVSATTSRKPKKTASNTPGHKTVGENLKSSSRQLKDLFEEAKAFMQALGDDVQMKELKYYFAFKRIKNFACIEVFPQTQNRSFYLKVFLRIDPKKIDRAAYGKDFIRDVSKIGHYGTGDLEVRIKSSAELDKAKPLIIQSYEAS
jgi:predicted transport protein